MKTIDGGYSINLNDGSEHRLLVFGVSVCVLEEQLEA
jgi:hypothetical protein